MSFLAQGMEEAQTFRKNVSSLQALENLNLGTMTETRRQTLKQTWNFPLLDSDEVKIQGVNSIQPQYSLALRYSNIMSNIVTPTSCSFNLSEKNILPN